MLAKITIKIMASPIPNSTSEGKCIPASILLKESVMAKNNNTPAKIILFQFLLKFLSLVKKQMIKGNVPANAWKACPDGKEEPLPRYKLVISG
jgi:hypothetical protein